MEFLQANWLWIVLGLGAVWFLFGRGRMGCGAGGHGAHGSQAPGNATRRDDAHDGHGAGTATPAERAPQSSHRHGGC